jgi:Flp pilus assembly protein TadG
MERIMRKRVPKGERGQTFVLVALSVPLFFGFMGFALDIGLLLIEKQKMQAAADSAAIAGAAELNYGDYTVAAQQAASLNGFTDGTGQVTVSVNPSGTTVPSPVHGTYAGQAGYLEVLISESAPTYFMKMYNFSFVTLQARAVASLGSSANCIYVLKSSGTSVALSNSAQLKAPGCGVMADSNGTPAVSVAGSASVTASWVDVVGTTSADNSGSKITPTAVTGVAPVSDPLSFLSPPAYSSSSCTADPLTHYGNGGTSYTVGPNSSYSTTQSGNLVCYTSLSLGSNGDTVTLNPGVYVITGQLSFANGTTNGGNGVTFYLAGSGSVNIGNGATANFVAPTTGTYDGILFYQDRSDTSAATVEGGSNAIFKGVFYFPNAALTIGNGSTSTITTQIVASTVGVVGGSNLTVTNYATVNASTPLSSPRLVD